MKTANELMEEAQAKDDAAWEKERREVEITPLRFDVVSKLSLYSRMGWNTVAFLPAVLESNRAQRVLGEKKIEEVLNKLNDVSVPYPNRVINGLDALEIFRPFEMAFFKYHFTLQQNREKLNDLHSYHEWELAEKPDHFATWIARLNLLIGSGINFVPALEAVSANGADSLAGYSKKLVDALHSGHGFADTLIADKAVDPWISFILKEAEDSGSFDTALSLIHEGLNKERKLK